MACGTPVVAVRRGSVPELIEDGKTGFIVSAEENEEAIVQAAVQSLVRVSTLDRTYIRDDTRRRFNTSVMVAGYERVYEEILGRMP